ncbi:MAG: saccharopine dehydrogenase NADP-binding domain-containing protein [Bacteroidetes bacterium]|nr:saccharopine dehydrogenase NADP-binding domain-containing protein [Bacteroidota bacterium]
MNIIVLGAGLVGAPMAIDLAKDPQFKITVADISETNLFKLALVENIKTIQTDLSDKDRLKKLLSSFDMVLSAVPGFMGYETLKTVIEAGKNVIDIAFFPEDLFTLDELAIEKGVIAISDIGVAPGMSNVLIGHVDHLLDSTLKAITYVGGLPVIREWPYEYKAGFSPIDVIEEYTRPARYIENGKEVIKPALSDPELINFKGVGTLEAFNSDGLRSLANTIDAPYMIEKTLRYPGHIEKMAMLRDTGFFNKEEIEVNGVLISPLDLTTKLLFPKWELKDGEEDLTIMQVIIEGIKDSKKLRYTYDLLDYYDPETKTHSMARTTGYTATMAVRMIASGHYTKKGVSAPEFIGQHKECVNFLLEGLAERGVIYKETIVEL